MKSIHFSFRLPGKMRLNSIFSSQLPAFLLIANLIHGTLFGQVLPSPVAQFNLDGNALDASSNANHGTSTAIIATSDRFGNPNGAVTFNGLSSFIDIPDNNAYHFGTGDFSVSCWFKTGSNASTSSLVNKANSGVNPFTGIICFLNVPGNGQIQGRTESGKSVSSTGFTANDNQWHQYVYTRQGTVHKLYLDGILNNTSNRGFIDNVTNNFIMSLGRNNFGPVQLYSGAMDDFRLFDQALSSSQVSNLFGTSQNLPGSGNAIGFDGTDDLIDLTGTATQNEFSLEMWVKPGSTQGSFATLMDNNHGVGKSWVIQQNGTNTNQYFFGLATTTNSNNFVLFNLNPNVWQHLTITKSASQVQVFINGIQIQSTITSGTMIYNTTQQIRLGRTVGLAGNWKGEMDEVRIWSTPLSQTQIRDRMCRKITSGDALFSNLMAYYNFDETSGNTAFDGTANGNNGTLANSPTRLTSGAAIGNTSAHNYGGAVSSVNLSHPTRNDDVTATLTSGSADGVQVYCVTEAPNSSTALAQIAGNDGYFGVFPIGGSSPSFSTAYNYEGIVLGATPENKLVLSKRDDNASTTWSNTGAILNETANTLTAGSNRSEFIVSINSSQAVQKPGSGNAISLDGIDDRISLPGPNASQKPNTALTVEAWIFSTSNSTDYQGIVCNTQDNGGDEAGYYLTKRSNGNIDFQIATTSSGFNNGPSVAVPLNKWIHVAATYDGSSAKIYINGILSASQAITGLIDWTTGSTNTIYRIGAYEDDTEFYGFQGQIDEVKVWNTALTQTQIRDRMCRKITSGDALFSNLVAYYNLDETSGNTAFDGTAYANNGTLANGPTRVTSGAAIGNTSTQNYVSTGFPSANLGFNGQDNLSVSYTAGTFTGEAGTHVYSVSEKPNTEAGIENPGTNNRYFGVFSAGLTNPQYTATYNYNGNSFVTAGNESQLGLFKRNDNATTAWSNASATLNTTAKTLTAGGQSTEYVLGVSNCTIPPTPTISAGGPTTFCAGGSVVLTSSAATGNVWSNGETTKSITVSGSGNFSVQQILAGCSSAVSVSKPVVVNTAPISAVITSPSGTSFCSGNSITLQSDQSSFQQWQRNGADINGQTGPNLTVSTAGTYTIVRSQNGCSSASNALTITENTNIPPIPNIASGGQTSFCQNGSLELLSSASGENQWFVNGTPVAGNSNSITATQGGVYTVQAISNGCRSLASAGIAITVKPNPVVNVTAPTAVICPGSSVLISASGSALASTLWFRNGGNTGTDAVNFSASQEGNYSVIATGNNGCQASSNSINLTKDNAPLVSSNVPVNTICAGNSITLSVSSGASFLWNNGSTNPAITVSPSISTEFSVRTTSVNACIYKDTIQVQVVPSLSPAPVSAMVPEDGSINQETSFTLSWQPGANAISYDLYVWEASLPSRPAIPVFNTSQISFNLSGLAVGTIFNWQVVSRSACQLTNGPVQQFTTRNLPDLVVSNVQSQAVIGIPGLLNVTYSVKNQGTGVTIPGVWLDKLFLSNDSVIGNDIELDSKANLNALMPGASYNGSFQIETSRLGEFFLYVQTDKDLSVRESNETNNITFRNPGKIQLISQITSPDVVGIGSAFVPSTAVGGQPFSLSYKVRNQGTANALGTASIVIPSPQICPKLDPYWTDLVYISHDSIFNSNAIQIGTVLVNPRQLQSPVANNPDGCNDAYLQTDPRLKIDSSVVVFSNSSIIPHTFYGKGYIYVQLNGGTGMFTELIKENNLIRSNEFNVILRPPADLEVRSILINPISTQSGDSVRLKYQIRNVGLNAPLAIERPWTDNVYLSKSPVFNKSTAILLKSSSPLISNFPPNGTYSDSVDFAVPFLGKNPLFFFVETDATQKVFEYSFETNNINSPGIQLAVDTTKKPDYIVQSLTGPGNIQAGTNLDFSFQVKNIGNANGLGFVRLNYYLRSVENNQLFSLQNQDISPIKLGQSLTVNASELVPFFIPGGNYNLLVKVDELASQVELNESNNSAQIPLQVASGTSFDIGISAVTAPDTIDIFQNQPSFQVSAQGFFNTIQPGPGMPKSCNVSIEIWDKTNPNIRYLTRTDLLSFSDSFPSSFTIPARTITRNTALIGQYKLRVRIDENFAQDADRTNQTFERNIFFRTSPVPDIVFAQTPATISLTAGAAFRIPIVIKNTGVNELQGVCVSRAALSNSPTGTEIISGGIIGSSQRAVGITNMPTNILVKDTIRGLVPLNFAGNYFLVLEVDADEKTFEGPSGESNNLLVLPVTISSPVYPDLVADPLVLPANVEAGRRLNISYVLRNQGSGQFSGISKNTFRFSKTGVFNPFSDGEIGSVNQQLSLNAGANQTFNASVVASGILPGNYRPGTFVNSNFQNSESNFANNESYAAGFRNLFINPLALDVLASESGFQGDYFYRSVAIGQGLDILAEFQGASGYASKDKVPVASNAEFSSPEDGSTELIIPSSESGTYYFGIRPSGSGPVGLKVRALPFSILSISPNKVGQGNATCEVKGAAYNAQTLFLLLNVSGQVVDTGQIRILRNSMQARVTFHCKNLALGFYTVRAIKAGLDTFDLANGLQVLPKSPTGIIIQDDVPSVVTAGSTLPITYRFLNAGNTDVENGFGQIIVAGFTNIKNIVVSSNAVGLNGLIEKTGVFALGGSVHQEEMDMFNFIPAWKRNMGPNEEFQISMELERFGSINSLPIFRTAQDIPDANFHQMMAEQVEKLRWISIQKLNKISNQQILDSLGGYWSFQRLAYQNLRSSGFFRQSDMDSIEAHPYYPSLLQPNEMKSYGIIFNPVAIRNLSLKYLCFAPLSEYNLPADSSLYLDITDGILHSYSSAFRRTPQDLIQSACNGDSVEFKRRLGNRFLSLPTGKNRGGGLVGNLNDGFVFGPCIYSTIFGEYQPNAQAKSGGGINSTQSGGGFQGDGGNFNPVDRCPGCFDDEGEPQAPTPVPPPAPPTGPPSGRDRDLDDFQPPSTKLPSPSCAAATIECTSSTSTSKQRCGQMYTVCTLTLCDVSQPKFAGCFPNLSFFDQKCMQVRYSCDPNEIDGPEGFGKSQFVAKTDTLPFTILFENDPVFATAAAGMVRIIQPLDINVKASALRLKQFGFGNQTFDVPTGQNSFTSEIDLSADRGIKVSVLGTIDILNRQLFWQFTTLDASTGLPSTNPDKGFLPVNDSTGKGEGFVSYTIMADSTTQTGDSLRAQAEIFFDFNEPVITNTHFNIVDALPPTTSVTSPSATQDETDIAFTWTANDDEGGSGVARTWILFKKDAGPLDTLDNFPADTGSVVVSGFETGHTYQFFFRTVDNVDNQEALATTANMTITIGTLCNDPAPTVSVVGPLTFCQGGSVLLTSSKPTGNLWSNGETTQSITVSAGGSFTVKTVIAGCTSAVSVPEVVTVNPLPAKPVLTPNGPITFCQGGSVSIATNAAAGHRWSTGSTLSSISVNTSATVADTAKVLGCTTVSDPITITVNPLPSVNAGANVSIEAGQSTNLTATGAISYVWAPLQAITPANGVGASVSVNPVQTTLYSVTGTDANNCSASDQVLVTVNDNQGPISAPVISPGTGTYTSSQLVSITSATTGAIIYYSINGVNPVIGASNTLEYTNPFGLACNTVVKAIATKSGFENSGVTTASLTISSAKPLIPGPISGIKWGVCSSSVRTYSISPVANATSYKWTAPANATIVSGQGSTSVVLQFASGFTAGVLYVQASNCLGTSSAQTISLNRTFLSPVSITGPTFEVCAGSTQSYSCPLVEGASGYEWSGPAGTIINSGQGTNTASITLPSPFASGLIGVKAISDCFQSSVRAISVRSIPSTPTAITGLNTGICVGSEQTFSCPASTTGATFFTWSVPNGALIKAGQGSNSITVSFPAGFTAGNVSVTAGNACGSSLPRTLYINSVPVTPGIISGQSTGICSGGNVTYSIMPVVGATSYQWSVPANCTITNNTGTSITMLVPNGFISGTVSVTASNACGLSNVRSLLIYGNTQTPGAITGQASNICSGGTLTYSIVAVPGALSYNWTAPAGCTIVSNNGTSISLSVPNNFNSGTLSVLAVGPCGNSATRNLILNGLPAMPGAITGKASDLCAGGTVTYKIAAVPGAIGYNWSVPNGATITSDAGTSITLSIPAQFVSDTISVVSLGGCGQSAKRKLFLSGFPALPGAVAGQVSNLCGGGTFNYSIAAVSGAASYNWTVPVGCNITSNTGTSISVSVPTNFVSGVLSVSASNACGVGKVRNVSMTRLPATPGVISGSNANCPSGINLNYSVLNTNGLTYSWTVPTGASIVSGQGTNAINSNWGSNAGNVTVRASNTCGISGARSLVVGLLACKENVADLQENKASASVFPNPGSGEFNLSVSGLEDKVLVRVFNLQGKLIKELQEMDARYLQTIDLKNQAAGMYLIQLSAKGFEQKIKVLKE
jgi:hypothetical protein